MPLRISLHPLALTEFLDAVDFYAEDSQCASLRFIEEIEQSLDEIRQFPLRYPRYHGPYRVKHLTDWEYSILYRVVKEVVRVNAIAHQKSEPDYWLGREW